MQELLIEFKNYMTIAWVDELLDTKIISMLQRNGAALNALIGVELDYNTDLNAKELLFNRTRYDYNNALEYFDENFAQSILRLQLIKGASLVGQTKNA